MAFFENHHARPDARATAVIPTRCVISWRPADFSSVDVQFRAPVSDDDRRQP